MAAGLTGFVGGKARGAVTGSGGGASDFFGGAAPDCRGFGRGEDEEKGQQCAIRDVDFGNGIGAIAFSFFFGRICGCRDFVTGRILGKWEFFSGRNFICIPVGIEIDFCSVFDFHCFDGRGEVECRLAGGFPETLWEGAGFSLFLEFLFGHA